uniref:Uncharacterized protein n=1 Tax=Panagrolaimus sp. PS1159 TaxID=55785 RepID=A0AC35GXV0_9BILA
YLVMKCLSDNELMNSIFYRPNNVGDTPLHIAAGMKDFETFNKILHFYVDVNPFNNGKETPLHFAVKYNHFNNVKRLLEISTFSVTLPSSSGTPLYSAVYWGSFDIVDLLIKNGADKCLDFDERKALLKTAVLIKNNFNVFKLLIQSLMASTENPNLIVELRQLCLKLAIKKHLTEYVEFLLDVSDWKEVIRRKSPEKETTSPMQHLIKFMPEMASKILDRCVDIDERNIYYYYEFIDDIYYIPNDYIKIPPELCVYDVNKNKLKIEAKERKDDYYAVLTDHPLSLMLKYNRYDLLSHKLVESYINLKWNRFIKWGYYSLCLYHLFYVIFLSAVVINVPPENLDNINATGTASNVVGCSFFTFEQPIFIFFADSAFD